MTTYFSSAAEFRDWLEANHATATELVVGYHKKATGRPSMTWAESVDQALCFGWIDGVRRRVDDARYTIRFTPRKPKSVWSAVNIKRAKELADAGLMHAAGLAAFEKRDEERAVLYSYEREQATLDAELEKVFRANARAWAFFDSQPAGYRKIATWYVMSAKREDTRRRRLENLIDACAAGRRIDQLSPSRQRG